MARKKQMGQGIPRNEGSKLMGIVKGREEVNGLGNPNKWISKFVGLA